MQLKRDTALQGGRYRIIDTLGSGGFGIIYLAEQVLDKRKVCIKEFFPKYYYTRDAGATVIAERTLPPFSFANPMDEFKDDFVKEAETIASLDHPNIIHIHDIFEENGTAYYVMEYVEGGSLRDVVKREGALSEAEAVEYIRQVATVLDYIHERKILHLDIKPSHMMLNKEGDHVIVIDFDISKQYDSEGNQTSFTPVCVCHGYSPMEQYHGGIGVKEFSPETDIYSLGATLYHLVTGNVPPHASDVADSGLPKLPSHLSSGVRNAIERSMEVRPRHRPHSIKEFLALLDGDDVTGCHNGHAWVDLGLSVRWATCNVGASGEEQYGNYYAWGETTPKDSYTKDNCKTLLKNTVTNSLFFGLVKKTKTVYHGIDIGDIAGNATYDAARADWGGNWRMPKPTELKELEENCTWTWCAQNGKSGYKVTGPNGNSIFLPAAGYRFGTSVDDDGSLGYYWGSTPDSDVRNACVLYFGEAGRLVGWFDCLHGGSSVRPVLE